MFGTAILILPLAGTMILFFFVFMAKGAFEYHYPEAHDYILRTYTGREYRDRDLKKLYTVKGHWNGELTESTVRVSATTVERAMLVANDERGNGSHTKFTAASAELYIQEAEYVEGDEYPEDGWI